MSVELTYLKEMSGGNKELALEMIDIFISQVKEFSVSMQEHYDNQKFENLGKLAHKAKSSISIMGLEDLAKDLKRLELMAKEGKQVEEYPVIMEKFNVQTSEAIDELNDITKNIDIYF
ncbi:MAG: hypothetical protein GVY19_07250 [Bacteroidetes bacterium]|jgi:HPt (histidine-containing phosphotransfer) domain-containing protein|nr:hypothetical protein [Bacteroidota bacterium]